MTKDSSTFNALAVREYTVSVTAGGKYYETKLYGKTFSYAIEPWQRKGILQVSEQTYVPWHAVTEIFIIWEE